MGQRGQLDRLHVAHRASVTTLDWCPVGGISSSITNIPTVTAHEESSSGGLGWIVSGGLDRTVKVLLHFELIALVLRVEQRFGTLQLQVQIRIYLISRLTLFILPFLFVESPGGQGMSANWP